MAQGGQALGCGTQPPCVWGGGLLRSPSLSPAPADGGWDTDALEDTHGSPRAGNTGSHDVLPSSRASRVLGLAPLTAQRRGRALTVFPGHRPTGFQSRERSPCCPDPARIPVRPTSCPCPEALRHLPASPSSGRGRHTAHTRPPGPPGSHLVRRRRWLGARSGCGAGAGGPSVGSGLGAAGARGGARRRALQGRRMCSCGGGGTGAGPRQPSLIWPRPTGPGGGVFPGEPPGCQGLPHRGPGR